ncbi:Two-component response regulator ARR10 [Capsicum baccatum]|uniref:Two-component response regulator n=1 Tax=Capsicum baccatum TaxID=33114 RepID=A0A2G2VJN5_CAPBA|nr:Two-component response regulator ARR10 [Capsicum baccatum]
MATSGECLNSGGVSGEFPTFRLLVVDDDPTCLRVLECMLKKCHYEVTTCKHAEVALSLLRENRNNFHLVISDVHMPDMDGFKLLELIVLEMNLPVIMMSVDDSTSVIMKAVIHGAHDYLVKPVSIEALKNIWQHVVRQNKDEWKGKILDRLGNVEGAEYSDAAKEGRLKSSKKRKGEEENEIGERNDTTTVKKARVLWSPELHDKFIQAINQLGGDKAVPQKILKLMNVPGLEREHVASHLQKYRLQLQKNRSGLESGFMGHSEVTIGTLLNNLDVQTLAPMDQHPVQNLTTHQGRMWVRPKSPIFIKEPWGSPTTKSPIFMQRNHLSFQNPVLRYQGRQQMNNSNKQVNLPCGIPTTEQFLRMNIPVARISQPQIRVQNMLSESNKILSQNGIVDDTRDSMYNQVPQTAVDFSLNQNIPLAGTNFLLSANSTVSATTEQVNVGYDNFSELCQQKAQDWGLQNVVGSTFDASMEQSEQNVNAPIAEAVFSSRQEIGHVNPIDGPQVNSVRAAERYTDSSYQSTIFLEPFEQDNDLMSALLEQQHESTVGQVDSVFGHDEDAFENLPV